MPVSIYDLTVPVFRRGFANLSAILAKGEAFAASGAVSADTLLQARLIADMAPLTFQIQRATDTAKGTIVRVGGVENVVFEDTEATFPDLQHRIARLVDFLDTVPRAALDGTEEKPVAFKAGGRSLEFTGRSYVLDFALPNFFFHVTTAYALLRQNGAPLGKADYLGWA